MHTRSMVWDRGLQSHDETHGRCPGGGRGELALGKSPAQPGRRRGLGLSEKPGFLALCSLLRQGTFPGGREARSHRLWLHLWGGEWVHPQITPHPSPVRTPISQPLAHLNFGGAGSSCLCLPPGLVPSAALPRDAAPLGGPWPRAPRVLPSQPRQEPPATSLPRPAHAAAVQPTFSLFPPLNPLHANHPL